MVIGEGGSACRCLSRAVLPLWEEMLTTQQDDTQSRVLLSPDGL